jgi:hypothetical protein
MECLCAEVRDATTVSTLKQRVREEMDAAKIEGTWPVDALVYIAPFKKWHRVFFNQSALNSLPVLGQLAHEPCDAPEEQQRRWVTA